MHVLDCPEYLALFMREPEKCLHPEAEYLRYKWTEDSPEARAERRDERLQLRFAELDRQQSIDAIRWLPEPDILAD